MGGLDVLVNNVGGPLDHVPFESVTEQLYDDVLNLNLKSVLRFSGRFTSSSSLWEGAHRQSRIRALLPR